MIALYWIAQLYIIGHTVRASAAGEDKRIEQA